MAFSGCSGQRRLAVKGVLRVWVDPLRGKEELDNGLVAVSTCPGQRRSVALVLRVWVDSLRGKEELDDGLVTFSCCSEQRRSAVVIFSVWFVACLNQVYRRPR